MGFFRKKKSGSNTISQSSPPDTTAPVETTGSDERVGAICPHCNRHCPALDGIGPFCAIIEANLPDLITLFEGGFDEARCGECQNGLGVQPTVMIYYAKPAALAVAPGTLLANAPDMAERVFEVAGIAFPDAGGEVSVNWFASLDGLREGFGQKAIATFKLITGLLIDGHDEAMEGYLREHWHEFTPGVFAVGHLAITGLVPGVRMRVQLGDGTMAPDDTIREILLYAQAMVWKTMCQATALLVTSGNNAIRFDSLLHTYVNTPFVIPQALAHFYSWQAAIDLSQIPLGDLTNPQIASLYCLEATNAWLCHLKRVNNPRVSYWAVIFYAVELAARGATEERAHQFAQLLLPAQWAGLIMTEQGARSAIAGLVTAASSSERLADMEEISAKAGYPGLVAEVMNS